MNGLIIYFLIGLCLSYILRHQRNIVSLISTKSDPKARSRILRKQEQLELYIKLCPIWPVLLIKEVYDEIKQRRQT